MEKSKNQNLKLGIFTLLGSFLLLISAYLIGNNQNLFGKTFEVHTTFKNVNGLQEGNNVRFAGINVGTVQEIMMINDTTIKVNMIVEDEMLNHIHEDAIVSIGSDGLVGSMLINILPGNGSTTLIEEGIELKSYSRIGSDDMMNTLNVTNENAALLTADLLEITDAILNGDGTLGKILTDTTLARDLQYTVAQVRQMSYKANQYLTEIHNVISKIDMEESVVGVVLTDSAAGSQVRKSISDLESTSNSLKTLTTELNTKMDEIFAGDGAIDYLTEDTVLVKQLETTMKNIEEGSFKLNENLEALKHNFLFRRYFKKQEKLKRKQENTNPN